jgi:hypothetical protein
VATTEEKLVVGFEVLTAVTMKNAVFRDVVPCWSRLLDFLYLENAGDTFLLNVGSHKTYMVPHPR